MKSMFQGTSIAVAITYVAVVAIVGFLSRPKDVAFPSPLFFVSVSLLPSLASWLLVARATVTWKRLVVAVIVFVGIWLVQLELLARYAVSQPDSGTEGLISNFYVFAGHFLLRVLIAALISLVLIFYVNRNRGVSDAST